MKHFIMNSKVIEIEDLQFIESKTPFLQTTKLRSKKNIATVRKIVAEAEEKLCFADAIHRSGYPTKEGVESGAISVADFFLKYKDDYERIVA